MSFKSLRVPGWEKNCRKIAEKSVFQASSRYWYIFKLVMIHFILFLGGWSLTLPLTLLEVDTLRQRSHLTHYPTSFYRNFLLLKLLNMFDLPLRHDKTKVNSFIEVRLLPNFGQNPIQTDVYAGDSNPVLEETFEFEVDREELNSQKIEFVIMDARGYSNRSIGYVVMNMDSVNIGDLMAEKEVNAVLTIGKPKMQKSLSQSSLNEGADSGEEMQYTSPTAEGLSAAEVLYINASFVQIQLQV